MALPYPLKEHLLLVNLMIIWGIRVTSSAWFTVTHKALFVVSGNDDWWILYVGRYFAVPYPLPKMDMIAIPDFAAGAMENYGLVTYRETALLFDERHSAAANKQRVGHYEIVFFNYLY